jgi:hypothetical protein
MEEQEHHLPLQELLSPMLEAEAEVVITEQQIQTEVQLQAVVELVAVHPLMVQQAQLILAVEAVVVVLAQVMLMEMVQPEAQEQLSSHTLAHKNGQAEL